MNKDKKPIGETENGYRVDKSPIGERLPKLGTFDRCYWKADIIGKPGIGPTPYWMKGFVVLNNKEFMAFKEQYNWSETGKGWKPSLNTDILKMQSFDWSYSKAFEDYLISTRFVGKVYFDLKNGVVFFEIYK